jgi:lipoprotein-anchoring transpeptidase ErfK/SrfK
MKHLLHSPSLLSGLAVLAFLVISSSTAFAQSDDRGPASRSYTLDERVKYQLWNYSWHPDETQPITKIVVHIKEQRVYVYQGDKLAAWSPTATGKPGHETPYGNFEVMAKDIDHKSNLFGSFVDGVTGQVVNNNAEAGMAPPSGAVYDAANMPYYLRITGSGVGFHAGYLPGYAASHGCIRLPHRFAELLYWNVALGTPVEITD